MIRLTFFGWSFFTNTAPKSHKQGFYILSVNRAHGGINDGIGKVVDDVRLWPVAQQNQFRHWQWPGVADVESFDHCDVTRDPAEDEHCRHQKQQSRDPQSHFVSFLALFFRKFG